MEKKVLITGITGFAGSHLAELLISKGVYKIYGTYLSDRHLDNIQTIAKNITTYKVNLLDAKHISDIIGEVRPDVIYHLAASTSVAQSFKKPVDTITNNAASEINVLEAVRSHNLIKTRILVTSSAHVYGLVAPESLPISESTPFRPDSAYAVSKITQDFLGVSYYYGYKLHVVIVRPFNHAGARLSPEISLSRFAKSIAEIEKNLHEPVISVGNLTTKRDFTDVHDMVRAYELASEKGQAGEAYNIGSGTSYLMQDLLDRLVSLSTVRIAIHSDQSLFRPSDIPELRVDASKFMKLTGWKPVIPIEQTLSDTLDYWRKVV